jgi:hypothetical protein
MTTQIITNIVEKIKELPPKISYIFTTQSPKTIKGEKLGFLTAILYMAPAQQSAIVNLCKYASPGCLIACLYTAGRGKFTNTQISRINKTIWFVRFKAQFWTRAIRELNNLKNKAKRQGLTLVVRFNGTSDQPIERLKIKGTNSDYDGLTILEAFEELQFYDYTKYPYSERPNETIPANYHLTYSYHEETTPEQVTENLEHGRNVAVVMNVCKQDNRKSCFTTCHCEFPKMWREYEIFPGDDSDVRILDPVGVIIALHAKGEARTDTTEFVIHALGIHANQVTW